MAEEGTLDKNGDPPSFVSITPVAPGEANMTSAQDQAGTL